MHTNPIQNEIDVRLSATIEFSFGTFSKRPLLICESWRNFNCANNIRPMFRLLNWVKAIASMTPCDKAKCIHDEWFCDERERRKQKRTRACLHLCYRWNNKHSVSQPIATTSSWQFANSKSSSNGKHNAISKHLRSIVDDIATSLKTFYEKYVLFFSVAFFEIDNFELPFAVNYRNRVRKQSKKNIHRHRKWVSIRFVTSNFLLLHSQVSHVSRRLHFSKCAQWHRMHFAAIFRFVFAII